MIVITETIDTLVLEADDSQDTFQALLAETKFKRFLQGLFVI